MTTMGLERSNEEFAVAAADLIDLTGLARAQYYDNRTGCYCTLGAFRVLMFGTHTDEVGVHGVPRYLELVDWFAEKVAESNEQNLNGESIIGMWSDGTPQSDVIAKLREVGRAAALTQEV